MPALTRLSFNAIGHDLGMLLHVPGAMALFSILIVVGSGEWYALPGFIITALLGLGGGQLLYRCCARGGPTQSPQSMIVVALSWLFIAMIGSIPFITAAYLGTESSEAVRAFRHPLNAFFESMSGFTSTGLTMTQDPSILPVTLQWWRSFTEWIGGVGVMVLTLALIEPTEDNYALYSAETRSSQLGDSITEATRRIWMIFLGYSIFAISIFYFADMPMWEAVNHGMTGIATGGFTITSESFNNYDVNIKSAAIIIMILGAVSFPIHHAFLIRGDLRFIIRQSQFHTFLMLFLFGLLVLLLMYSTQDSRVLFIDQLFQWASAMGTCGFSSVKIATWAQSVLFILMIGMFIGGMAGSTTGGLKVKRITWLSKSFVWRLQSFWLENRQSTRYRYNGKDMDEASAMRYVGTAALYAFLYIVTLATGTLVLFIALGNQYNLYEILFEAMSALGSVGLSVGVTSTDLPQSAKLTLIGLMWMGRLEIIAVLVLISSSFMCLLNRR
ncbi:TrkH family potassium uptake protein [Candidatus Nitrospira salsa]